MKHIFPRLLRGGLLAALLLPLAAVGTQAQELQKIRLGAVPKAITPILMDFVVGEYLGYYKEEGMTVEALPLGSNAAAAAALESGRVEFYLAAPIFQLPLLIKGERAGIDFFQSTYPFKYAFGVKAGSGIKSFEDLKGKSIGVAAVGNTEYPVGQIVVRLAGLDPDKDVSWLSVGDGASQAVALDRGDVAALFTIDTNWGLLEALGLGVEYLDLPPTVPQIGGVFVATTPEILKDHRDWAVGFARAVAKAHYFVRENPEAAAYIYGTMYPEALPKGKSLEEQIAAIMAPVKKRMKLYLPADPAVKQGYIDPKEWTDEISFAGLQDQLKDASPLYTNDLIDEINDFDPEKIKAEARAFKLPYKD